MSCGFVNKNQTDLKRNFWWKIFQTDIREKIEIQTNIRKRRNKCCVDYRDDISLRHLLLKRCLNTDFFWSLLSHFRHEHGAVLPLPERKYCVCWVSLLTVFWRFQEVEKGCIGGKCVKVCFISWIRITFRKTCTLKILYTLPLRSTWSFWLKHRFITS